MGATGLRAAVVAIASFACVRVAHADDPISGTVHPSDSAGATARTGVFAYNADAGIGATDNITQTATPKITDEMAELGLQFTGLKLGSRLQAAAAGDLQYLDFVHNTYSREVIGNFSGMASFAVIPEYFRWTLTDSFGQGLVDPFVSATPGNRENINSIATGPAVTVPLGGHTFLSVTAGYDHMSYEVSPLDNNQYSGSISLARLLSQLSRISIVAQSTRFDFRDPINPNYDQREAYVRYDVAGARTKLWAEAGYVQSKGTQLDTRGFLGRLSLTRTLAADSILNLTAGREESNSGAFLTQLQNVNGIGLEVTPGQQTSAPFTNNYVTGSWQFIRRRTTMTLSVSRFKQAYANQSALDQTLNGADARLSRILSPTWSAGVYVAYSKQTYQLPSENATEWRGGAEVNWQLGRLLALRLQYQHDKRDSGQALYTYSANTVFLRLQFGDARQLQAVRMSSAATSFQTPNPTQPFMPQLQRP
jgi:hypothetical protein